MNFLNSLLPTIEHFHNYGYWIAFFAALFETIFGIGLLFPGSTIILILGALSAKGYFDIGDIIWFSVVGAFIGDNINFYLGRKYGTKWIKKKIWFLKPEYFEKAKFFFVSHGARSIFFGRFIPSVKEIIPFIAGSVNMRQRTFFIWNALGAIGWGIEWAGIGYLFAYSLTVAETWLSRSGFLFVLLLAVSIIFYFAEWMIIKYGRNFFLFLSSVWSSIKHAVANNPDVVKLVNRHPSFFRFITKRLDKSNFYGLTLTLFIVVFIYVFFLFGGIVEDLITSAPIVAADIRVANLLAAFRSVDMTKIFLWITLLGKSQIVIAFVAATIGVLWLLDRRSYITPLMISVVGSATVTQLGKFAFHRARPEAALYFENSFSFPSGHATIAVAFYGFLTYMFLRGAKKIKVKMNVFFAGAILILLIGFSRLYLGVHYVSDVWSGYLVGALWLIIGISISEWLYSSKKTPVKSHLSIWAQIISAALILSSVLFYVAYAKNNNPPLSHVLIPRQIVVSGDLKEVFTDDQLKYTETLIGDRQEPISFIITVSDDNKLIDDFQSAGWSMADKINVSSIIGITKAVILNQPDPKAPMTPSFWNAQVHDFGFEKSTGANNVRERHHAKFWKTNYVTKDGKHIYVGTASLDTGIKWGITHKISPDIDTEREFLFSDLQKTGTIAVFEKKQFVEPILGKNFSGDIFFTDGKAYFLEMQ